MRKPVCAVVGVGEGNGAALARAFAEAGMAVALLARRTEFTSDLAQGLPDARAYVCDASDPTSVASAFAAIRDEMGDPATLIYNAGSGVWGDVESISSDDFESAWRVNAYGALAASREVIPAMKAAGSGSIIFIGATASRRGGPRTAAFGPAKAAQRSLAESMARTLWPQGIHVALVVVDAVVDLPGTRRTMPDKPDSFFLNPDEMAMTALWLAQQPRSAWTFEVEVRPFGENWSSRSDRTREVPECAVPLPPVPVGLIFLRRARCNATDMLPLGRCCEHWSTARAPPMFSKSSTS
jgi:NAD(P)-dependent dehydrogenase (short-subunit alcohol dehydrogenase family)